MRHVINLTIVSFLASSLSTINSQPSDFFEKCGRGDFEKVKEYIEKDASK